MHRRIALPATLLWLAATACQGDESAPADTRVVADIPACDVVDAWAEDSVHNEERVIELLNEARRLGGRCGDRTYGSQPPLRIDPSLRCAARMHAFDMEQAGYLGYKNPEDPEALNTAARLELAGYPRSTFVEAVGAGWQTADEAVAQWLADESHCWKLMTEELEFLGIGQFTGDADDVSEEGNDDVNYGSYWDLLVASPQ
jgi:uncharacterized protein YkwD